MGCALLQKQNFHSVDNESDSIAPLHCQMQPLEVLAHCVDMGWMAIIVRTAIFMPRLRMRSEVYGRVSVCVECYSCSVIRSASNS